MEILKDLFISFATEYVIHYCVDKVVKVRLQYCSDESEKRKILMAELATLFMFTVFLFQTSTLPIVLVILTASTLGHMPYTMWFPLNFEQRVRLWLTASAFMIIVCYAVCSSYWLLFLIGIITLLHTQFFSSFTIPALISDFIKEKQEEILHRKESFDELKQSLEDQLQINKMLQNQLGLQSRALAHFNRTAGSNLDIARDQNVETQTNTQVNHLSEFEKKVLLHLNDISDRLPQKSSSSNYYFHPISTFEELHLFNVLIDDMDIQRKLVDTFTRLGNLSIDELVRIIMTKLMTNSMTSQMSFKKGFSQMPVCSFIIQCILHEQPNTSLFQIYDSMKIYFRNVPS